MGLLNIRKLSIYRKVAKSLGYLIVFFHEFVLIVKKKMIRHKWSTVGPHWYAYHLPKKFISDLDVDEKLYLI